MLIIYLLSFVTEVIKYAFGYYIGFSKKLVRGFLVLPAGVLYLALLKLMGLDNNKANALITVFMALLLLFCTEEKGRRKIVHILFLFYFITCMDGFIEALCIYIDRTVKIINITPSMDYLIINMIGCLVILCITVVKKRYISWFEQETNIPNRKGINYFVPVMGIGVLFANATLGYAGTRIDDERFALATTVISAVSYLGTGLLGIFIIYIIHINEKLKEHARLEKQLSQMQEKYYKELLEKERDTRKYRHDLSNYLIRLEGLAEEGDVAGVKNYIAGMQEKYITIEGKVYLTGCRVLDSFINYYVPMLDTDTSFSISGKCSSILAVSEIDLCAIFANLIQNAVEDLNESVQKDKYLKINIIQREGLLEIQIINSTSGKEWKNEKGYTSKKAKRDHGFGLENVREAVERNGGEFSIVKDSQEFIAMVVLRCHYPTDS